MVHHGQGLPLGLEAGDHLIRVHPRLDDLQRDPAAHGQSLLSRVDDAHAALADLFHQLVGADHRAGALGGWRRVDVPRPRGSGRLQEAAQFPMHRHESPQVLLEPRVAVAGPAQEGVALVGVRDGQRDVEDLAFLHGSTTVVRGPLRDRLPNLNADSARGSRQRNGKKPGYSPRHERRSGFPA
jgi:hypothetical protein